LIEAEKFYGAFFECSKAIEKKVKAGQLLCRAAKLTGL
jgi:hypothetical protein